MEICRVHLGMWYWRHETLKGLRLNRIGRVAELPDTPEIPA
jgi:ribosomal protein L30/L7E